MRGRLWIARAIQIEVAHFLCAGFDGRRYDKALHRQRLCALLERYERRIKKRRGAITWPM
jgi:hypothetical protein